MKAATRIRPSSGARLMREASAIAPNTPNNAAKNHARPGRGDACVAPTGVAPTGVAPTYVAPGFTDNATSTPIHIVSAVNATANMSEVMKCDCWICMTASELSAPASRPCRRLYSRQPMIRMTKIATVSAVAAICRPNRRCSV